MLTLSLMDPIAPSIGHDHLAIRRHYAARTAPSRRCTVLHVPTRFLLLGLALLATVSGCESARSSAAPPAIPADLLGELRGTWTGTWGGMPVTLLIVDYTESAAYSGLYFGPWLIAGGRYPGVGGILTYVKNDAPTSVRFQGWIASSSPFVMLVLAEPPDGQLRARLRGAGAAELAGEGDSTFWWGPRGPIELTRR